MPEFKINKPDIKLWNGGSGSLVVNVNADPLSPVLPGAGAIVDAKFEVGGSESATFGSSGSLQIGFDAGTRALIAPIFAEAQGSGKDLVSRYELTPLLNAGNVLLAMEVGGDANLSATGAFRYTVLSANATLKSGVDVTYFAARSFPRPTPLLDMVKELTGGMTLPGRMLRPPAAGEVVALEFGGYLNFGVGASAGYQLKGTNSFKISEIALSEKYALSVIGKLNITGQIAGRFSVEVRQGSSAGWARVVVRRKRSRALQFAADVNVKADLKTQGLPSSGKEFLGALLGVEAKNWLNQIDGFVTEAGEVNSIADLKAKLDGLSKDFVATWTGKAIDQMLTPEVKAFQARIAKVVSSYRNLDENAIALFDRYFDPVLNRVDELTAKLDDLKAMTSWDNLKGEIDGTLWNVIRQLTGGDPLGWALGKIPGTNLPSLPELQKRVGDTKALIEDAAHEEIRSLIRTAKEHFGLDPLMNQLGTIATSDGLKQLASTKLGHFVERLIGDELDKMNGNSLKKAFETVQKVVGARDQFFSTFDQILKEAAAQSFRLNLFAAYNSSDERTAMIDVEIRMEDETGTPNAAGIRMMEAAGRGDFQDILANFQPSVVRIKEGLLTHRVATSTTLKFNVAGWHRAFSYEEMHRVIVNTEQQIRNSGPGILTVFTKADMSVDSERRRNRGTRSEETMLSNFLLRFLGETKVSDSSFDQETQQYVIDVITGMSAQYKVSFTDADTTPAELDDYLLFGKQLGLDAVGATREGLTPVLELKNGSFGKVDSTYEVKYTEAGLKKLFGLQADPADIKNILRRIVLANFYGDPHLGDVGWLYASDDVRKVYDANLINFENAETVLGSVSVVLTTPIAGIHPPRRFQNTIGIRRATALLFRIEDDLLDAFGQLTSLLQASKKIKTADLEKKLKKFGDALNSFDKADAGDNSVFAVFDGLIALATDLRTARASSLTFQSMKEGAMRTKVFTLQAAQPAAVGTNV